MTNQLRIVEKLCCVPSTVVPEIVPRIATLAIVTP